MPSYRVELHSHCHGDPVDTYLSHSIFEQIDRAKEVGLDAIAITWHRKAFDHPEAEAYARKRDILLISGMEAEVDRRHLLVLNVSENDLSPTPTWDEIRALKRRKPEVLVLAPHPFYPHPSCLGSRINAGVDCIDAVEWCFLHVRWLPGLLNPNLRAARWARRNGKTLIACSDAHSLDRIGRNASTIEAEELTPGAIFTAIRAGRVAFPRPSFEFHLLVRHVFWVLVRLPQYLRCWTDSWVAERRSRDLESRALHTPRSS